MPFTPSHTAIVLPLLRSRYFCATALIIGCMVPDFEYFFTMSDQSYFGHTLAGVFYFDLPVVLVTAIAFHQLIKPNLLNNLPYFIQRRFDELRRFSMLEYLKENWIVFAYSAILGTFTHLAWDSFTHPETWAVKTFSIYDTIVPFQGARYPFYYFLQYISSYAGLFFLLLYLVLMKPVREAQLTRPSFLYWLSLVVIALVVLFLRFHWSEDPFNLVLGLISSISAITIGLLINGMISFSNPVIVKKN